MVNGKGAELDHSAMLPRGFQQGDSPRIFVFRGRS
jgi:hypothetical protein